MYIYSYVCVFPCVNMCMQFSIERKHPHRVFFLFFFTRAFKVHVYYYYILRGVFRYSENPKGVGVICAGIDERTRLH